MGDVGDLFVERSLSFTPRLLDVLFSYLQTSQDCSLEWGGALKDKKQLFRICCLIAEK